MRRAEQKDLRMRLSLFYFTDAGIDESHRMIGRVSIFLNR